MKESGKKAKDTGAKAETAAPRKGREKEKDKEEKQGEGREGRQGRQGGEGIVRYRVDCTDVDLEAVDSGGFNATDSQREFTVSDPVVSYRETVSESSNQTCLAKSPNKHNRIYLTAEPLPEELSCEIESGKLGPKAEAKERARMLREKYDRDDAMGVQPTADQQAAIMQAAYALRDELTKKNKRKGGRHR